MKRFSATHRPTGLRIWSFEYDAMYGKSGHGIYVSRNGSLTMKELPGFIRYLEHTAKKLRKGHGSL